MEKSARKEMAFGLTTGIITTLGLLIGLSSEYGSNVMALGDIITIAIADAFSVAPDVHMSVESETKSKKNMVCNIIRITF